MRYDLFLLLIITTKMDPNLPNTSPSQNNARKHISYAEAVRSCVHTPLKSEDIKCEDKITETVASITPDNSTPKLGSVPSSTPSANESTTSTNVASKITQPDTESLEEKPKSDSFGDDDDSVFAHDEDNLRTRVVTKTIHNKETGSKKMIRKVERIQYSTKLPVKGTLTEHGFTINDEGGVGELPFFI